MVRKYQNTIKNPYEPASAANASGSLQTALSKLARKSSVTPSCKRIGPRHFRWSANVFLALWEPLAWAAASRNASGKVAVARISPARPLARFRYSQIAIVEGLTYLAVKFPSISLPSLNVTKNFPEIDFRRPLHP